MEAFIKPFLKKESDHPFVVCRYCHLRFQRISQKLIFLVSEDFCLDYDLDMTCSNVRTGNPLFSIHVALTLGMREYWAEITDFDIEEASLDMEFWETQLPSQWAGRTGVL